MQTKKNVTVEETLGQIVAKALRQDQVVFTGTTTFKELGVDSLHVVQILVAIEDTLHIELVDKEIINIANMGELIRYIKLKMNETNEREH
jgi:acyl carrier protein